MLKPPTKRAALDILWAHSVRGSKEIGFMMLVMLIGLACAPLPSALLIFLCRQAPSTLLLLTALVCGLSYAMLLVIHPRRNHLLRACPCC